MRQDNETSMSSGPPDTGAGDFEFTPDKIQNLVTSTYAPVKKSAFEQVARWFTKVWFTFTVDCYVFKLVQHVLAH